MAAFGHLKQREYRWFRLDPFLTFAALRPANQLPRRPDGQRLEIGQYLTTDTWPNMQNFHTGPFLAANLMTPVEDLLAWLDRKSPAYLMTYAQSLEKLAFAVEGRQRPVKSFKALISDFGTSDGRNANPHRAHISHPRASELWAQRDWPRGDSMRSRQVSRAHGALLR
jgi:hypothetical protein